MLYCATPAVVRAFKCMARLLVCLLLLLPVGWGQKADQILLSFSGVLKIITSKEITIEPEPGNTMEFVRTHRTKFTDRKSKAIKPESIHAGDSVTVQAEQKMTGELEAVVVTLEARQ